MPRHALVLAITLLLFAVAPVRAVDVRLQLGADTYHLHSYRDRSDWQGAFGVYRLYLDMTGGHLLHLFPDGTFAYTAFCDICFEELLAFGTFSISGGVIRFSSTDAEGRSLPALTGLFGQIHKGSYVTGGLRILASENQLKKLTLSADTLDFWMRLTPYYDWEAVRAELRQGRGKR